MEAYLCGFRQLDFQSDTGPVKGTQLFCSFSEDGIIGERTERFFIRDGSCSIPALKPGMMIDLSFDRKGKVEHIKVIPEK